MEIKGHIDPCWDISDFHKLEYKLDKHKDQLMIDKYLSAGHSDTSLSLYNYFEPNPMPACVYEYIKPNFALLSSISIAVNLFKPGQFIPYHFDQYQKFIMVNDILNSDKIARCVLMLEDGHPGQILEIGKTAFSQWTAGTWFMWQNVQKHAFYNFSMHDRYALQITGIVA